MDVFYHVQGLGNSQLSNGLLTCGMTSLRGMTRLLI